MSDDMLSLHLCINARMEKRKSIESCLHTKKKNKKPITMTQRFVHNVVNWDFLSDFSTMCDTIKQNFQVN